MIKYKKSLILMHNAARTIQKGLLYSAFIVINLIRGY